MESENAQTQKSVSKPTTWQYAAPPSLLTGVQQRLNQREALLTSDISKRPGEQELLEALRHPAWEMRSAAAKALASHSTAIVEAALGQALHDEHPLVRVAALRALVALRPNSSLVYEYIIQTLQDDNDEVREMALVLLNEQPSVEKQSVVSPLRLFSQPWRYAWNVLWGQLRVLPRSIWASSATVLFMILALHLLRGNMVLIQDHITRDLLAISITAASVINMAYVYGRAHDPGLEFALATPTSPRLILLCRMLLVTGYNLALAVAFSSLLVLLNGGTLWSVVQLWLGPLLLLSATSLAISMLLGSLVAIIATLAFELTQMLTVQVHEGIPHLNMALSSLWQTQPAVLLIAALLLIFALLYTPRNMRFA
ncbi:HEAT repeat domain-containing protein [Ktedonobacter racemifer]|uniref:PBS lyase HEAT domain protein repeat-containing protein n=1 Tax=Ktedonobacter racemifer DSM 44963 TaxID=485913 RepID=D6TZ67_KTERA|nr:HEAT repeat domain-containing protein [Ktedonobacter racemifer]EFH81857.1 hypothetical protein Krac_2613 [Ktedonobacter racemifer DSM 44963]